MSWQAVQWALHRAPMLRTSAGKFDATARFVLTAVAEHADTSQPPRAHPSLALLRYTTGLDMKTVQRALARLAAGGLIETVGVRGDGVTEWALHTNLARPASDREAIDAEVQDHRDRDRRRKQTARSSGALNPDNDSDLSGTQHPDFRTLDSGQTVGSRAQSPDVRGVESGQAAMSGTLNPDSGALSPDVRDAEPARTDQGTTRNRPTCASTRESDTLLPDLEPAVKPSAKSKKRRTPDVYPADFIEFWTAAPRRRGTERGSKPEALKEWRAAVARGLSNADLIAAAHAYGRATDPVYIKDTCRWLKGELYEPYLERAQRHAAGEPTDAELDAVLGKALVTLPAPPAGIHYGTPAHQEWKAQFFRDHRAERVRQYLARTARRTARSSA